MRVRTYTHPLTRPHASVHTRTHAHAHPHAHTPHLCPLTPSHTPLYPCPCTCTTRPPATMPLSRPQSLPEPRTTLTPSVYPPTKNAAPRASQSLTEHPLPECQKAPSVVLESPVVHDAQNTSPCKSCFCVYFTNRMKFIQNRLTNPAGSVTMSLRSASERGANRLSPPSGCTLTT